MSGFLIGPGVRDELRAIISERRSGVMRMHTQSQAARFEDIPSRRQSAGIRLGKTTAAWNKGTLATITLYEEGTPPSETTKTPTADTLTNCVNKFANVSANKWVMLAKAGNGYWYLIAAECTEPAP